MTTAISVRLPDELVRQMDAVTQETGVSKSRLIREAMSRYMEDMLDNMTILYRVRTRKEPLIPLEDVMKELGITPEELAELPYDDDGN
jgi:predicted DNA-binding protein